MTSSRFFTPRPVRCEVRGPLTAENAADIAQWCGGTVVRVVDGPAVLFPPFGTYSVLLPGGCLLRHPDGSYTAMTPEELDEGWVEVDRPCPRCDGKGYEPSPEGFARIGAPSCLACFGSGVAKEDRFMEALDRIGADQKVKDAHAAARSEAQR